MGSDLDRIRRKRWVDKHRETGFCVQCASPAVPNGAHCQKHRDGNRASVKRQQDAAIAAGLCRATCNRPAEVLKYCTRCWWKNLASKHLGGARHSAQLIALAEAQGYRCALTGVPLRPGVNLSVDHIIPKARGGSLDISNCRLVTTDSNIAKQDMLDEEFLALCRAIVEHRERTK